MDQSKSISHSLPGDVGTAEQRAKQAAENWRVPDHRDPAKVTAMVRPKDDCIYGFEQGFLAALTPSPCPGGAREADIALLGARMVLEGKATNATGALAKSDWKPSRAHIEGMRNTMREAIEYIDEARAALTPSALSGDAGEGEQPGDYLRDQMMDIASICEAKALHVEAASLRSAAMIVSEQLRKPPFETEQAKEALAGAVSRALYGADFDPFAEPEKWDFAEGVAAEALAAIAGDAK